MSNQDKPKISKFGKTFISYGSYHYDNTNKIIHIICIPIITATLFALLSYIPYSFEIQGYQIGFQHIFAIIALLFYLTIHPLITIAMGPLLYFSSLGWKAAFANYSQEQMFRLILILQIIAWVLQFVGHGVFQKRKPALMDNLLQIFSAPIFVIIQLFDLIGIRTKDVQIWKQEIKKNVMEFRKNKSA